MRAIWLNFLRYSCWAAVGAVTLTLLLILWVLSKHDVLIGLSPVVTITGGIAMVVVRATVGIVSRYPAGAADRMTAIVVGRFLFGWLLGRVGLSFYLSAVPWNHDIWRMLDLGWMELAFRIAGALAMVITGWLAYRPHGRLLIPISWLMVFLVFVFTWFSIHEQFPHLFKRHFL